METKRIEDVNETQSWLFERIYMIDKAFAKVMKRKVRPILTKLEMLKYGISKTPQKP
jgi:hypothetical protein